MKKPLIGWISGFFVFLSRQNSGNFWPYFSLNPLFLENKDILGSYFRQMVLRRGISGSFSQNKAIFYRYSSRLFAQRENKGNLYPYSSLFVRIKLGPRNCPAPALRIPAHAQPAPRPTPSTTARMPTLPTSVWNSQSSPDAAPYIRLTRCYRSQ